MEVSISYEIMISTRSEPIKLDRFEEVNARVANSSVRFPSEPIQLPPPLDGNSPEPWFPATLRDFMNLRGRLSLASKFYACS